MAADDPGIPGFEQVEPVGKGGFGVVYQAYQPAFRRTVAIKVLTAAGTGDPALETLQREAAAMGSLSGHPNVVTVHEAGLTDRGLPYLVMPFLPGGSLADRIATAPLGWRSGVAMAVKIAGALATAHDEGVLHRDVKPDNVLFSAYGDPLLADFGIARVGWTTDTEADGVQATVLYAPPEVLGGGRPGVESDVYSLAATFYAAVAGTPAFYSEHDESLTPLISRIATEDPAELGVDVVPPPVWEVVRRAMAKDPAERTQTAAAFGRRLQQAQRALGVAITPITLPPGQGVEDDDETEVFDEPPLVPVRETLQAGTTTNPSQTTRIVLVQPDAPGATGGASDLAEGDGTTGRGRRRASVAVASVVLLAVAAGAALLLAQGGGGGAEESETDEAPVILAADDVAPADRADPSAGALPRPTWRSIEPVEPGTALLRWDEVEGAAGFAIQQGDDVISVVEPGRTEVQVGDLDPTRRTCFLVGALTEEGEASWTAAQDCVSTSPPATPTVVAAEDRGDGDLFVEWTDEGRNARDYTVELDGEPRDEAGPAERSVTISGLPDGREVCVVVVARNEVGRAPSAEECQGIS